MQSITIPIGGILNFGYNFWFGKRNPLSNFEKLLQWNEKNRVIGYKSKDTN